MSHTMRMGCPDLLKASSTAHKRHRVAFRPFAMAKCSTPRPVCCKAIKMVLPRQMLAVNRRRNVIRAAMFDDLGKSLEKAWNMVKKDGRLTAENVKEPIKEVRRALLEADVSLPVVRRFVKKVEEKALGTEVLQGVTPDIQFKKVVFDELVELMGSAGSKELNPAEPQIILMAGLQGVGKTTACGKLALYFKKAGKKPLMVATDVYRPAAIDQLVKLGSLIDVPVFELGTSITPVEIARRGVEEAKRIGADAIIVDTAGRLQIDTDMMQELKDIKAAVSPSDTLLVVDAMTGQEAASLVKSFNDEVELTGAVLTKMDGDSRGGAALSVREVSGKPIKFVGVGEKLEALELFYPERMANRILGMGDILTLFEKAQTAIKEDEAQRIMKKMAENKFDYDDFLNQFKMMNNMGSMQQVMKLMPGMNKISEKQIYEAEKMFKKFEGMINAMTPEERADPQLIAQNVGRRRRIAEGSGQPLADVNSLVSKFAEMRIKAQTMAKMMKIGAGDKVMSDDQMMKELITSTQKKVADGKVRRRKEPVRVLAKTAKGFGSQS